MALQFKEYHRSSLIGTGAYVFRVYAGLAKLSTPQNVQMDGSSASWDEVENATVYDIVVDGNTVGEYTPYEYAQSGDILTVDNAPYEQQGSVVTLL